MSRAELLALASRVEAETADGREIMFEAWLAINGSEPASGYSPRSDPPFCPKWEDYIKSRCRFLNLLQAEAYESSAITLVPEGWEWAYVDRQAIVRRADTMQHTFAKSATPALALTAAALRAHAEQNP
jgi:hypothetical protein